MNPIEKLNHEHGLLHLLLASMTRQVQEAECGGKLNIDTTRDILDVVKVYAMGLHQERENRLLTPKLRAVGVPFDSGPMYLMQQEHTRIKEGLSQLFEAFDELYAGNRTMRRAVLDIVPPLANFIRLHMMKEENSVFPFVNSNFTHNDWEELSQAFEVADVKFGCDLRVAYEARIVEIAASFGLVLHGGMVEETTRVKLPRADKFVVKSWQPA